MQASGESLANWVAAVEKTAVTDAPGCVPVPKPQPNVQVGLFPSCTSGLLTRDGLCHSHPCARAFPSNTLYHFNAVRRNAASSLLPLVKRNCALVEPPKQRSAGLGVAQRGIPAQGVEHLGQVDIAGGTLTRTVGACSSAINPDMPLYSRRNRVIFISHARSNIASGPH